MSLNGKLIYDGEAYALFQRYRLGVRAPLLCQFLVILKTRGAMQKATFQEKSFLLAVVGEMTKLGIQAGTDEFEELFERFCQAVFARGQVTHRIFFGQTARAAAHDYVV